MLQSGPRTRAFAGSWAKGNKSHEQWVFEREQRQEMDRVREALAQTRLWRRIRIAGLIMLAGAFGVALFPGGKAAAADGPCGTLTTADVYINCVVPSASTPYASFTDGDPINLAMGPNTVFSPGDAAGGDVEAIECEYTTGSAPGDPPNANYCSAQTLSGGWPFSVNSDGSFDYASATGGPLNIYAVPGTNFAGSPITCDATDPCVWYVGENFNSFTAPHVFSNPFVVIPAAGTTTTTTTTTTTMATTTTVPGSTTMPTSSTTTTPTTSTTTTTSTPSGSTTTTTSTPGSTSTTSTTTAGSGATTTTSPSTAGSGGGSGGGSGSGGNDTSASSVQLAFTGASPVIIWMLGLGMLFVIAGTVGRLTVAKSAR